MHTFRDNVDNTAWNFDEEEDVEEAMGDEVEGDEEDEWSDDDDITEDEEVGDEEEEEDY